LVEFADGDEYKICAAEFYLGFAGHLCAEGDIDTAKTYVAEAARVFPGLRMQMLDDPALAPIFGGGNIPPCAS